MWREDDKMNKPLVWPNTTVPMLMYLGDWKVQVVLSSFYVFFSTVWTSGDNMDLATVFKYEITFLLAKSNLQYLNSLTAQKPVRIQMKWERVFPLKTE